jgi:hypothetical protein
MPLQTDRIRSKLDRCRSRRIEIAPNWIDTASNRIDTAPNWIDTASDWIDAAPNWIDAASNRIDTAPNWIDTASDWIDTALNRIDTAPNRIDAALNRIDTAPNWIDAASNRIDTPSLGARSLRGRTNRAKMVSRALGNQRSRPCRPRTTSLNRHRYPNVIFANRRSPTFSTYDLPLVASSVARGSLTFASSTSTPPWAMTRWASLFDSERPAATMTFDSNCGSAADGGVVSSISAGAWRSLKMRRNSCSAASAVSASWKLFAR